MHRGRELSFHPPIEEVIGLTSSMRILFMGRNMRLPSAERLAGSVWWATEKSDVRRLVRRGGVFDRVIVARENYLTGETVVDAIRLSGGFVCLLSGETSFREGFTTFVTAQWPSARVWSEMTNVGEAVMTDARGRPSGPA